MPVPRRQSASDCSPRCELDPAAEDLARARRTLLAPRKGTADPEVAGELSDMVIMIYRVIAELDSSDRWPIPPTSDLLAAMRRNSELSAWLAANAGMNTSSGAELSDKQRSRLD